MHNPTSNIEEMKHSSPAYPRCITILFPSSLFILPLQAQPDIVAPKWEVRAVWLTTAGGADWPKTYDVAAQKKSLVEIFETFRKNILTLFFFKFAPRGNTFYKSQV